MTEAQAAIRKAEARLNAAKAELSAAEVEVGIAHQALQAAKLEADSHLPKARMTWQSWRGTPVTEEEMVITKRTAKQVTVRRPGADHEWTFRLSETGRWRLYPQPKHWKSSTATLEICE